MTSPYRALPVVVTVPRSVCVWCRHARVPWPQAIVCDAREHLTPCPVLGRSIADRGRDCYSVRAGQRAAGIDECPDFEPTIGTRVLRAIGARR